MWVSETSPMGGNEDAIMQQVVTNGSITVAYGSSDALAGSDPSAVLLMWTDDGGDTWHAASTVPFDDASSTIRGALCWSDDLGVFLVSGWSSTDWIIATSPDGDVWTQVYSDPTDGYGVSMWAPSLGLFSVMTWTPEVLISPDGSAWTVHATTDMGRAAAMAWSESLGVGVCVGKAGISGLATNLITTTDGINWTNVSTEFDLPSIAAGEGYDVIWSDTWDAFYAVGTNDDAYSVLRSYDGVTWDVVLTRDSLGLSVGELIDGYLLVQGQGNYGYLSRDGGDSWSRQPLSPMNDLGFAQTIGHDPLNNYVGGMIQGGSGKANDVVMGGGPINVVTDKATRESPYWRYFVAALDGTGITDLSRIVSSRFVEVTLNAPLQIGGSVPSDNPQVWIPYAGDGYYDPYLSEGTRLIYGFRREFNAELEVYEWVCRASTLANLVEDEAAQDDARTSFVGYDPWMYLFSRPICNADGSLPGKAGMSFTATQASVIIATLLKNSIDNMGFAYIDAGTTYSGSYSYTGTLETGAGMVIDINFPQGTTVGQAWQTIASLGVCDIVLTPIYTPYGRTLTDFSTAYNFLCELNVYAQAGTSRPSKVFAWNMPGRSLTGITRQQNGRNRADVVKFYAGPGGNVQDGDVPEQDDADAITKYGEYWTVQFFPQIPDPTAVLSLAQQQLALRANGQETVTFRPAPERSPRPWQDYDLGDRCPVWASPQGFRQYLGRQGVGTIAEEQYQRIYGWRASISDDALETIDPVLTSPQGFTA